MNNPKEIIDGMMPQFENMMKNGFPVDVKLMGPGLVQFTKDNQPVEFEALDIEALKFYINTMLMLNNGDAQEEGANADGPPAGDTSG